MLEVIARKGIAITRRRALIGLDIGGRSAGREQRQDKQGRKSPAAIARARHTCAGGIHRSKHP